VSDHLSDLTLQVAPPTDDLSDVLALGAIEPTSSSGALYSRSFGLPFAPQPASSGIVAASIQSLSYLSLTQVAERQRALSLRAVLRTDAVFVDRSVVHVAIQLRDAYNNVQVSRSGLSVRLAASFAASVITVDCSTADLVRDDRFYVQHCSIPQLPQLWFAAQGETAIRVEARYNGDLVAASLPGAVRLTAQPEWYGRLSSVLSAAGSFGALPASPVYGGEAFALQVFGHTGGFALETWWVFIEIDGSLLEFVSFIQSDKFNGVSFTSEELASGIIRLGFNAVGTKGSTRPEDVTGTAVPLVVLTLRFASDVTPSVYSGILSVFTRQFINPGSNPFVSDLAGVVVDSSSGANGGPLGSMQVRGVSDVALFAYTQAGTLGNLAPLTGEADTYPITVVRTDNDDRVLAGGSTLVHGANCSSATSVSVLALNDCTVFLSLAQTEGAELVSVAVGYFGLEVELPLGVYYPSVIAVRVLDDTLERIVDAGIGDCKGGVFQQTRAFVELDGLDASPLVSFAILDSSVATIVPPHTVLGIEPAGFHSCLSCGTLRVVCFGAGNGERAPDLPSPLGESPCERGCLGECAAVCFGRWYCKLRCRRAGATVADGGGSERAVARGGGVGGRLRSGRRLQQQSGLL